MLDNFKIDFNNFGYFFWFVFFGILAITTSISTGNIEYLPIGVLVSIYGMIGHLTDLLFDRIGSVRLGETLTSTNMHKLSYMWHVLRFLFQFIITAIFVLAVYYSLAQVGEVSPPKKTIVQADRSLLNKNK